YRKRDLRCHGAEDTEASVRGLESHRGRSVNVTVAAKRSVTRVSDGSTAGLPRVASTVPAPAAPPAPAPIAAPFPPPAIAPITAPIAAPPPTYSPVRLLAPRPWFWSDLTTFSSVSIP